jgi:hypothetical protein
MSQKHKISGQGASSISIEFNIFEIVLKFKKYLKLHNFGLNQVYSSTCTIGIRPGKLFSESPLKISEMVNSYIRTE